MYPKILPAIIFDKCIRLLKKKLLECYFLFSSYFYEANLEIQKLKNNIAKDANKFIQIKFSQSKVYKKFFELIFFKKNKIIKFINKWSVKNVYLQEKFLF